MPVALTVDEFQAALREALPLGTRQPQAETLWHYTDAEGLKGIIETNLLWATHFAHLNDAGELRFGRDLIAEALNRQLALRDSTDTALLRVLQKRWHDSPVTPDGLGFIVSFCADGGNELGQWRGYGGFGAGYSIGFRSLPPAYILLKVEYREASDVEPISREVREALDKATAVLARRGAADAETDASVLAAADQIFKSLVLLSVRTKNYAFRHESEWRLLADPTGRIEYRATRRGLVPFTKLHLAGRRPDLEAVYVGPAYNSEASASAVRHFLRSKGYENADDLVRPSGITFRP